MQADADRLLDGLSPRVQGNLLRCFRVHRPRRSIPACAGEPSLNSRAAIASEVYPRVCRGTTNWSSDLTAASGLSPRVQGNRRLALSYYNGIGSIPACAGEPGERKGGIWQDRVYPRVCRGTATPVPAVRRVEGLSPRVQGNPTPSPSRPRTRRSIPACAGEPTSTSTNWQT